MVAAPLTPASMTPPPSTFKLDDAGQAASGLLAGQEAQEGGAG
jgi:hypothetical protein